MIMWVVCSTPNDLSLRTLKLLLLLSTNVLSHSAQITDGLSINLIHTGRSWNQITFQFNLELIWFLVG